MLRAVVNGQLCRACRPCPARNNCRIKALMRIDDDEPPVVDQTRCRGCGDCVGACPYAAIVIAGPGLLSAGTNGPALADAQRV